MRLTKRAKPKKVENARKRYRILRESRTHFKELGMDRARNKFFWSPFSDGRVFIFHRSRNEDEFCWSFVSKSSDFYLLLSVLDKRRICECELLQNLTALKEEIIRSMAMLKNDDFVADEEVEEAPN